jgi:hypothetical protein
MSITEDAPAPAAERRSPLQLPGRARRASPWWWLVLVASVLLVVALGVMAVWGIASSETQVARYRVLGSVSAIELDVGAADVEIVGGAPVVEVRRTAEFAFGRPPEQTRRLDGDTLQISSRCPDTVVGTCRAAYRIAVRDNVQVNVITTSGRVRVSALNGSARLQTGSGAIAVDGFCGFQLIATSASGDVRGAAACSPDRMELRSTGGDVRAAVPAGRYRVDASSSRGAAEVRNLTETEDAPFAVQAISGTGDVLVEGRG